MILMEILVMRRRRLAAAAHDGVGRVGITAMYAYGLGSHSFRRRLSTKAYP